jgi:hypothetical protein
MDQSMILPAIAAPFLASSNPDGLEQTTSLLVRNNIESTITLLFSDINEDIKSRK